MWTDPLHVRPWRRKAVPSEISVIFFIYIFPTVKSALLLLFYIFTCCWLDPSLGSGPSILQAGPCFKNRSRMVYLPTGTSDLLLVLEYHNKSVWPPTSRTCAFLLCILVLSGELITIVLAKLNKLPVSIKTSPPLTSNVIEINKPPPPGGLIEDFR